MIKITSNMPHALNVPFLAPRGVKPKFFTIPPQVDGRPGVIELPELDSITINRLRHHYDHRPVDMKDPTGEQSQIGLLKIEVIDGGVTDGSEAAAPARAGNLSSSVEPPRKVVAAKPKRGARRVA